jgi:hypothetical protein
LRWKSKNGLLADVACVRVRLCVRVCVHACVCVRIYYKLEGDGEG